ncbi:hypothetical protein MMC12_001352 [Toensbergia leucococca]|nr:hypothetical protein [Toensbergia leucococca]
MSVEAHSPVVLPVKSQKKAREKLEKKREKKRKRDTHDDFPKLLPTKKHRSKDHSKKAESVANSPDLSDLTAHSPFHHQTSSLYLPLSPISQLHPLRGLCAEHLSPLILTYYPPFHGVVLSYSDPRLSEDPTRSPDTSEGSRILARSVDEYAVSYVWITADFLMFKPRRGDIIEGWINLHNEGHLGLVCWNLFNASIERKRLPKEWVWVSGGMGARGSTRLKEGGSSSGNGFGEEEEEMDANEFGDVEGYFEDADGKKIEGQVRFRVKDIEASPSSDRDKGFLSIEGTMLDEAREARLLEKSVRAMAGQLEANGHMEDRDQPRKNKHRATY